MKCVFVPYLRFDMLLEVLQRLEGLSAHVAGERAPEVAVQMHLEMEVEPLLRAESLAAELADEALHPVALDAVSPEAELGEEGPGADLALELVGWLRSVFLHAMHVEVVPVPKQDRSELFKGADTLLIQIQ